MGMGNICYEVLRYFGQQMGISQIMEEGIAILAGAMLLLALLSCFFGYKFFRVWSAVMAFFLTAIGITALMSGVADRGVVVTTFAILGIMVGFLVYQWPKVSAFLLCGLIGYGLAMALTPLWWLRLVAALAAAVVTVPFSQHLVMISTAVWGALVLGTGGPGLLGWSLSPFWQVAAAFLLACAGILVQYGTNREIDVYRMRTRIMRKKSHARKQRLG